jgi:hypothetical protein
MKKLFIYSLLLASTLTFAQNKTATTDDGKKVILKSDKTWEYDTKSPTVSENDCNLGADFVETKTNERLRKHVAVENDCKLEEIKFISMVQEFGSGTYSLCVKGKKMKYKKVGSVFMRAEQDPLKMN